MSLKFPDGRVVKFEPSCKLGELRENYDIPWTADVFSSDGGDALNDDTMLSSEDTYFIVERPTEVSQLLASILGSITYQNLLKDDCCIRFTAAKFTTRESLRSILNELRGLGLDAFSCNAPRVLNICSQSVPYEWDCCADCDTNGECDNDDFDWTPYQVFKTKLNKSKPYKSVETEMWILTFPPGRARFAEQCRIYWGIIPHREGRSKSQRVRQSNMFQIDLITPDHEQLETLCAAISSDEKRIEMEFIGPKNKTEVTREILEASKKDIHRTHPYFDNIQAQLDDMLSNI